MILFIIILYLILSSITAFLLYKYVMYESEEFGCTMLGFFFPLVWLYFLVKLPIIIYDKYF